MSPSDLPKIFMVYDLTEASSKLTFLAREHDDVIKWNYFPRYWPFVRGIHRQPMNSTHKKPVTQSFDAFFDLRLNKRLSKQSRRRWLETPSRSLWRDCNEINANVRLLILEHRIVTYWLKINLPESTRSRALQILKGCHDQLNMCLKLCWIWHFIMT